MNVMNLNVCAASVVTECLFVRLDFSSCLTSRTSSGNRFSPVWFYLCFYTHDLHIHLTQKLKRDSFGKLLPNRL